MVRKRKKKGVIKRNSATFCKRLSREYKLCKRGSKGLRKDSTNCFQSAIRESTKKLSAVGKVRCSIVNKRGKRRVRRNGKIIFVPN